MTVQGPVKKQQRDGMSQTGGGVSDPFLYPLVAVPNHQPPATQPPATGGGVAVSRSESDQSGIFGFVWQSLVSIPSLPYGSYMLLLRQATKRESPIRMDLFLSCGARHPPLPPLVHVR